jgi:hypothetical protein
MGGNDVDLLFFLGYEFVHQLRSPDDVVGENIRKELQASPPPPKVLMHESWEAIRQIDVGWSMNLYAVPCFPVWEF